METRWINERWARGSLVTLDKLIVSLENEGIEKGVIKRRSKNRRTRLRDIIRNCVIYPKDKIHYTRKNDGYSYKDEVDFLENMKLVFNFIEKDEIGNQNCSFLQPYDQLIERFSAIAKPVPRFVCVVVKKKGDNTIALKAENIPNQPAVRLIEKKIEKYNELLSKYILIHPRLEDRYPIRYKRIFNGGSLAAKQGGRYYTRHPAQWVENRIDAELKGKPRDFIKIANVAEKNQTKSSKVYQTVSFDFTALHFNLIHLHSTGRLYSKEWSDGLSNDPYRINDDLSSKYRSLVKFANMAVLGSKNPKNTLISILEKDHLSKAKTFVLENQAYKEMVLEREAEWNFDYYGGPPELTSALMELSGTDNIDKVVDDYKAFHESVLGCYRLNSKLPLTLQYIDSNLATNIIERYVEEKTPVWIWHDQFLVPYSKMSKSQAIDKLAEVCNEELMKLVGSNALSELDKFIK